ncbi:MAG: CGGC domain-containing protein [Armatimonadetes bacterium]|nr:CGGC domain-containing protein [Armatimonadota bacterium]
MDPSTKDYVAIVQCHIVKQRCAGYFCEQALQQRTGGFAAYPADRTYRHVMIDCGGCCGRGLQRKLANLVHQLEKQEGITRDRVAVQLSSCITKDSHHGPPCPHLDYLKTLIARMNLEVGEDTRISRLTESRRESGEYQA